MNGAFHQVPAFHPLDAIPPVVIACVYILASSLLREPSRRNFNAIMIGGAGAAYLSGGFGMWEPLQFAHDPYAAERSVNHRRQALAAEVVNDAQNAEAAAVTEGVGDEVERPALIDRTRQRHRCPCT